MIDHAIAAAQTIAITAVYSFNAAAGTEVWFDIGMTSPSLSSILELVDAKGNVLATSNPATQPVDPLTGQHIPTAALGVLAFTLEKDPSLGGDFYSANPRDAGMRVILPGAAGTTATYFIRVRSDQALTQAAQMSMTTAKTILEEAEQSHTHFQDIGHLMEVAVTRMDAEHPSGETKRLQEAGRWVLAPLPGFASASSRT